MNKIFCALGLLLLACGSAQADGHSFTLQFNPPEMTYDLTVKTTKIQDMGPYGVQTDKGVSQSKVSVKKTSEGFAVVSQPISMLMTRNGQELEDPSRPILLQSQITYRLGPTGQLLTVEGYHDLVAKLQATLPPEARAMGAAIFNEETLIRRDTAEWQGRIADLIGRTLKVGDTWSGEYDFTLPTGGSIRYYSVGRVKEAVPCEGKKTECLRIEFKYNSDAGALSEMMGTVIQTAAGAQPLDVNTAIAKPKVDGEGSRLIDPSTMLIREETLIRTVTLNMSMPDGTIVPAKMTETKEYAYKYPEGK